MKYQLDDAQVALQDSVRRWASTQYGFDQRMAIARSDEGLSADHWADIAALGWLAATLPTDVGGLGGSVIDSCIIAEEFGRRLVLEPFGAIGILCAQTINLGASSAQRQALLPPLLSGKTIVTLAHNETAARGEVSFVQTKAQRIRGGWRINGHKSLVTAAHKADLLVVSARTDGADDDAKGISLFMVRPSETGLTRYNYRNIDDTRMSNIILDNVEVNENAVLGTLGSAFDALDRAVDCARVSFCAEALGLMEQSLCITRDYIKTRKQFGVSLNSFQALQHRMSDMYLHMAAARAATWRAVFECDNADAIARRRAVSAAKIIVGNAGRFVTGQAIQLHGAIGLTQEHIIGHYFKRMTVIEIMYGNTEHHTGCLAASLQRSHAERSDTGSTLV